MILYLSPTATSFWPQCGPANGPTAPPITWAQMIDIEPRLRDIAADAAASRWSVARYDALKRRAAHYVGWHARDPRLASSRCYEITVWHIAGLMRSRSRRRQHGR